MAIKQMTGFRFGKLVVLGEHSRMNDGAVVWLCVCDCGKEKAIAGASLRAGRTKSCGCASPKFTTETTSSHGMSRTRTYRIWHGMRQRCSDAAKGKVRRNYFDKGIRVCERWEKFENFFADMGEAPVGASIDRINGNGNYEPSNCRWATPVEQGNNTSANVVIEHLGEKKTISQWARDLGLKVNTLVYRLRRKMPVNQALTSENFRGW